MHACVWKITSLDPKEISNVICQGFKSFSLDFYMVVNEKIYFGACKNKIFVSKVIVQNYILHQIYSTYVGIVLAYLDTRQEFQKFLTKMRISKISTWSLQRWSMRKEYFEF